MVGHSWSHIFPKSEKNKVKLCFTKYYSTYINIYMINQHWFMQRLVVTREQDNTGASSALFPWHYMTTPGANEFNWHYA